MSKDVLTRKEIRKIRKSRQHIHFKWAGMAAFKLTEMGHPTRLDEGYSMICAKIKLLQPELRGGRHDIIAAFIGEGEVAAQIAKRYGDARKARKAAKKAGQTKPDFYESEPWRRVRYQALVLHGGACQCCGATRHDGVKLHVDHIQPRSKFPELELSLNNLQVLCEDCNLGKSNKDATDWRPAEAAQ